MRVRFAVAAAAVLVALLCPAMTAGHGGAYLIAEPATVSADGELGLRGAGFGLGAMVTLVLVSTGGDVVLGSVEADGDGSFATVLRVPPDALPGLQRVEARSDDHLERVEVRITAPVPDEDGAGRRDEEEPLLVPISPVPAPAAPGGPVASEAQAHPAGITVPTSYVATLPGFAASAGLLMAAILVVRHRRRGRLKDSGSHDA